MSVRVAGEIAGEAEIRIGYFEPQRLTGRVDWREYRDDSFEQYAVSYRPRGRVSGRLVVYVQFH